MAEHYTLAPEPVPPESGSKFLVNPPSDVQRRFFNEVIRETGGAFRRKLGRGPLFADFERLRTPEGGESPALDEFIRTVLVPRLTDQSQYLPVTFSAPRERRAYGEGGGTVWGYQQSSGSLNACTRMVLDSILGWRTDEVVLREAMLPFAEDPEIEAVRNDHYLNLFESGTLQRVAGRRIQTAYVAGADIGFLRRIVTSAQSRKPGTEVYCIADTGYRRPECTSSRSVIVTNVAHGMIHLTDSNPTGAPSRVIDPEGWALRWGPCNNAAMLVVAHPPATAAV